jgi:hypothetical protein
MTDPAVLERELAPFYMVRDYYEKAVIARDCAGAMPQDGIKIISLTDFLLQANP